MIIRTVARKRPEAVILAEVRLAVGVRPDFLVTRINTGVFEVAKGARVKTAPAGFPDLIGTQLRRVTTRRSAEGGFMRYEGPDYWHYYGQSIAIETKSKTGRLSEAQANWKAAFERMGGVYVLARSVDDVTAALGPVPEWVAEMIRK